MVYNCPYAVIDNLPQNHNQSLYFANNKYKAPIIAATPIADTIIIASILIIVSANLITEFSIIKKIIEKNRQKVPKISYSL